MSLSYRAWMILFPRETLFTRRPWAPRPFMCPAESCLAPEHFMFSEPECALRPLSFTCHNVHRRIGNTECLGRFGVCKGARRWHRAVRDVFSDRDRGHVQEVVWSGTFVAATRIVHDLSMH